MFFHIAITFTIFTWGCALPTNSQSSGSPVILSTLSIHNFAFKSLLSLYNILWRKLFEHRQVFFCFSVPGDGGSQIEIRLTKDYSPPKWWCDKENNNYHLYWFSLERMMPWVRQCTVRALQLRLDENGQARNMPGVLSRQSGWGDTHTVEYFDSFKLSQSKMRYFNCSN